MPVTRLLLLGQPSLEGPAGSTPLQPTKPNALGCFLAAQAGGMITRSRIIATFWEELPEPDGRRALRTTLGRLRKTVPPWPILSDGDLLGWDSTSAIAVDTSLLATLAKENAKSSEPLWRGPFLDDFHLADAPAFDQWLHEQRQHWEGQFLEVLNRLVVIEESNGVWDSVAAHARQALRVNPFQERFHRALMEALYRGGDRPAALAQYAALKELLQEELGVEPDHATTRLRDVIMAQSVDHTANSAARPALVQSPSHPAQLPPRASLSNLPAQSTRFIGRQADMAAVKARFPITRLLTLTGAGGSGKTRLALQVAADLLPARADGIWFVELASLSDPDLVPAVVASTLGLHEQPDRSPLEVLVVHLQFKKMLLVLDNCEHLVQACAVLADTLLRSCADLWMMVTSREALGIPGEGLWPLPPLCLPAPDHLPLLNRFRESDAIDLFLDRAAAVVPNFTATVENAPTIARICRRLDGMPLAIELAAALVKVLSVDEIDARLGDRFGLLQVGSRTASTRQQTLRGAVDWSYGLLAEAEKALWRRLSIFAGGFTLVAAEAVCSGADLPPNRVLERLHRLVDKSLVIAEEHGGERRFRLLETIRQYGLEKLRDAAEEKAVCERHRDWFLGLAEQAALQQWGPQRAVGYGWFDREQDNLRAAMDWSRSVPGGAPKWIRLAWPLAHYWDARGHLREGRERVAELLEPAGAPLDPAVQASACTLSAYLATMHGDFSEVIPPAERGLALWRELGNKQGMASCLMCLGVAAYHGNEVGRAVSLLEECLTLGRAVNADTDLRLFLFFLAEAVAAHGDLGRARTLHEESLALSRASESVLVRPSLFRLARLATLEGDLARAAALHREGLSAWDSSYQRGTAMVLDDMAIMAVSNGQAEQAVCMVSAAHALWRSLNGLEPQEWRDADQTCTPELPGRSTGLTVNRGRRADREQALAKARSRLGEGAFAEAWSLGQSLSPKEAIAYALSELGGCHVGEDPPLIVNDLRLSPMR